MIVCRSIYVKKVMKLLAFIFEQPSYYARFDTRNFSLLQRKIVDRRIDDVCMRCVDGEKLFVFTVHGPP